MGILRGGHIIPRVIGERGLKSLEAKGYKYVGSRAYLDHNLLLESALRAMPIGGYWMTPIKNLFYVPFVGKDAAHTNYDIFEYVGKEDK